MRVYVLDQNQRPLTPCRMARARILLNQGKAAVFKQYPFTIILKYNPVADAAIISDSAEQAPVADASASSDAAEQVPEEYRLKIDPGSKTSGIAIVHERTGQVITAAEIGHRGQVIKAALDARRALRRGRRARKTRYRAPQFDNRTRPAGWLPPSLVSRITNIMTWVVRFCKLVPITAISQELVKFDLQQLANPEISGVEYQRGTLFGYEIGEYLLEKLGRKCAYCGKTNVPLQKEHIIPRSRGGTDRVSNLSSSKIGSRFERLT